MTTDLGVAAPLLKKLLRRSAGLPCVAAIALTVAFAPPHPADANDAGTTGEPNAKETSAADSATGDSSAGGSSAGDSSAGDSSSGTAGTIDVRKQIECLARTIYFEARGEPDAGKLAVGHVVMNRVASDDYPDTVCGVMQQGGEDRLHRCQFSFYCDGRSDQPQDKAAWRHSQALARAVFWDFSPDPTGGARWYHADYVSPDWGNHYDKGPVIGQHVFYLAPGEQEPDAARPQQIAERPAQADGNEGGEQ